MVKIQVLSTPIADWKTFIREVEIALGFSPTRGLDNNSTIDIKDPSAFLACVDLNNNPVEALRNAWINNPTLLEHGFITISVRGLNNLPFVELAKTGLTIIGKIGESESIYILSGTVGKWVRAILSGCNEKETKFIRLIMNEVFTILKRTGYRELFEAFSADRLTDGTFNLRL